MFEDKQYEFTLVANESEEMHEEWETSNFEYPLRQTYYIHGFSLESAISNFQTRCKLFSNGDWDWESNEEGTEGWLSCGNDQDGLTLRWEFKQVMEGENNK